jgi:two-component system, NarL family, nitrate/nitrite response regulator NarL
LWDVESEASVQRAVRGSHNPLTVVLIDDHAMFRRALCRLLSKDHRVKVLAVAESGAVGVEYARGLRPAVVVTDLRMPGMSGVEVTRAIAGRVPGVDVLALSVSEDQDDLLEALRAGARGYVLKSSVQEEIVPAILAVGRGESWLSPKIAGQLIAEFRSRPRIVTDETLKTETHLTRRERAVVVRLAQGMTNREIAVALGIAETTVKTHLRHVLEKLHVRNRLEAASIALRLELLSGEQATWPAEKGGNELPTSLALRRS